MKRRDRKILLFFRNDGKRIAEQNELRDFIFMKCNELGIEITENVNEIGGLSLVLTIGGDGTFLAGAKVAFAENVPIAGINLGHLGFLAEINPDEKGAIVDLLEGRFDVKQRMAIDARLTRSGKEFASFSALNEITVHRDMRAPMFCAKIKYNGEELPKYKGDGVIVATPTGSTAYNLSCNGPILYPTLSSFVINTIAPHALTYRPIVLPSDGLIEMRLEERMRGVLLCDGKEATEIFEEDVVLIKRSLSFLKVVSNCKRNFFDVLSKKFHLGKNYEES